MLKGQLFSHLSSPYSVSQVARSISGKPIPIGGPWKGIGAPITLAWPGAQFIAYSFRLLGLVSYKKASHWEQRTRILRSHLISSNFWSQIPICLFVYASQLHSLGRKYDKRKPCDAHMDSRGRDPAGC